MNTDTNGRNRSQEVDREQQPEFVSDEVLDQFESETDAFEYSLLHWRKSGYGSAARHLASKLKWSAANFTKVRQGQAGFPVDSSEGIPRETGSYALPQLRNKQLGLVSKTVEQEQRDVNELEALRRDNEQLKARLEAADNKCMRLKEAQNNQ